jgi:DNA-directed RNA polymerase subunit RPC12/RpoP
MKEPRQKSIGITPQEKAQLDKAKRLYETNTGDHTDWGKFLGIAAAVTLGTLGIYRRATSNRNRPSVACPNCGIRFVIAHSEELPRIVQVECPECSEEIVIDFGE